ncbi:MAG: thiamine pyrophosphate-dependent enzyme [Candidatus Heimdallarchaeaceae archaeon]
MPTTLKDLMNNPKEALLKGHFACAGCGSALAFRHAIGAIADKAVVVIPACCTSVYQGFGRGVAFNVPTINVAFASSDAVAAGIKHAMEKKGKEAHVVAWAGDGGTADIGIATLIGACDRQDNILHIMYSNNVYSNTGGQRSGDTPIGARTTTTPFGNKAQRKMVPFIMMANNASYVATASVAYIPDLVDKVKKAISYDGFKFIEIDASCPVAWKSDSADSIKVARLAVETGVWPLFEWNNKSNKAVLSKRGSKFRNKENRKPIEEWLNIQGRFKGMSDEEIKNLYADVDRQWTFLEKFLE